MDQTEFVQAGTVILQQGTPGDYAYRIKSGRVEVSMQDMEGRNLRLAELGPGEIVGEIATLMGGERRASVRVTRDAELIRLSRRALQESMKRSSTMHAHIMDTIARRTVENVCLFSDMTAAEREALPKGEGPFAYTDKKDIFTEQTPIQYLYVVCGGFVQEYRKTPDGAEITVDIYKTGDFFCKTALFMKEGVYHTNARALNTAQIVKVPISQFRDMLKYESVATRLFACIAKLAMMKQMEVEQHATMTAPQLLANFLRQVCLSHGYDPSGFDLPFKKSVIASRLGMKLETLSRAWPKLREQGISVRGSRVVINEKRDTG
jgi:CRP-like cAMP-binding protein